MGVGDKAQEEIHHEERHVKYQVNSYTNKWIKRRRRKKEKRKVL